MKKTRAGDISAMTESAAMLEKVGRNFPTDFLTTFAEVSALQKSDYGNDICRIIASGEFPTACMNLYKQNKILVNPTVMFNDLNDLPENARRRTYGFSGVWPEQEKSYESFQTVCPDAALVFQCS